MSRYAFIAVVVALAGLVLARETSAQKLYKWTDNKGQVHFSNVAPAEGAVEQPTGASPPAAAPSEGEQALADPSAKHAELSDDLFSSTVSSTRSRLKRELAAQKAKSEEAAQKLATLQKERDQPPRIGIELLQKAYGPNQKESSEEGDLRKQRADADRRVEAIRKEYTDLHEEAVKRVGHEPAWWLRIE